jgi:hypothetical protein
VKFKKMDLVVVRWVDSCGGGGDAWSRIGTTVANLREAVDEENISVGWLIFGDEKCIILASHLSKEAPEEGDQFGGELAIPRVAIRAMKKVKA